MFFFALDEPMKETECKAFDANISALFALLLPRFDKNSNSCHYLREIVKIRK